MRFLSRSKVTERFPMLPLRLVSGAQAIKVQTPLRSYAFTKISEMIIDIDMAVRVESSRILGELKHIGIDAMLQTLSKRVLPPSAVPSGATADDAMDVDAEQSGTCLYFIFIDPPLIFATLSSPIYRLYFFPYIILHKH